ncbi:hypothetical protein A5871_002724 [Enterococcus sp. 2F9_DIV0599]|nr:hypothetical protein A5871_002724 [Enterococcus sp. 2F9_DIV0599]
MMNIKRNPEPVSYTHLDVYKRQRPYIVYIQFTIPYSPLYIVAHFYNMFYYIEEDKEW